jgi:SagB-type dehydrogenase family enzyme
LIPLDKIEPGESPAYEASFYAGNVSPKSLDRRSVSQLFFDSLAISAWKRAGDVTWPLRVNPSSGNLHPTEGYLVCGPVDGLTASPVVAHYAPREHALEVRTEFALQIWQALVEDMPPGTILLGLASIHWREAWKYGVRAFRYCQHDVGHAIAALSIAAAGLGWRATLLDELGTAQLAQLLGLGGAQGAEAEHADCLLAVHPQGLRCSALTLPERALAGFDQLPWQGEANRLSRGHVDWPLIDDVAAATEKPPTEGAYGGALQVPQPGEPSEPHGPSLRQIIRQRRSAVAMDGRGRMSRETFYKILGKTLAGAGQFPFNALPWAPLVHLVLFLHRVEGLLPGLYLLLRDATQRDSLQALMREDLSWERPASCPAGLELYRLATGDVRALARQLSCRQDIAADGCFSLGMVAGFEGSLRRFGPWFYRRLYWECGLIGQVLYLEAEASGVRGTGIGCFFDDAVHELLGLGTLDYQSLYHFTVGYPIEDARLATLPAYPDA